MDERKHSRIEREAQRSHFIPPLGVHSGLKTTSEISRDKARELIKSMR